MTKPRFIIVCYIDDKSVAWVKEKIIDSDAILPHQHTSLHYQHKSTNAVTNLIVHIWSVLSESVSGYKHAKHDEKMLVGVLSSGVLDKVEQCKFCRLKSVLDDYDNSLGNVMEAIKKGVPLEHRTESTNIENSATSDDEACDPIPSKAARHGKAKAVVVKAKHQSSVGAGGQDVISRPTAAQHFVSSGVVEILNRIETQNDEIIAQNNKIISLQLENEVCLRESVSAMNEIKSHLQDTQENISATATAAKPFLRNAAEVARTISGTFNMVTQMAVKLDTTYKTIHNRYEAANKRRAEAVAAPSVATVTQEAQQQKLGSSRRLTEDQTTSHSSQARIPQSLLDQFAETSPKQASSVRSLAAFHKSGEGNTENITICNDPLVEITVNEYKQLLCTHKKPQGMFLGMIRCIMGRELDIPLNDYRSIGSKSMKSLKEHPMFQGILSQIQSQYPDYTIGFEESRSFNDFCRMYGRKG